jgi:D-3-phosphoglycerate dehydrogenase
MRQCRTLRAVSFTGAGVENFVDLDLATELGITVMNTPHYGDNAVAEHTLALLFALVRRIPKHHFNLVHGIWDQSEQGTELRGKTIGIIGFGGIGRRVAYLSSCLGMKVLCWTRKPDPGRGRVEFVSLEELLRQSDIISLHLALTPETRGIIGKKEIGLIKRGAYLINTARAELVDSEALIEALRTKHLAGAAFDVYEREPLPADSPLLSLDNVVLTPHVGFNTPEATKRIIEIAVENLINFARGVPTNVVSRPLK